MPATPRKGEQKEEAPSSDEAVQEILRRVEEKFDVWKKSCAVNSGSVG